MLRPDPRFNDTKNSRKIPSLERENFGDSELKYARTFNEI